MSTYTSNENEYWDNVDREMEIIRYQLHWEMTDQQYQACPINWDIISRQLPHTTYRQRRWLEAIAREHQIWSAVQLIVTYNQENI